VSVPVEVVLAIAAVLAGVIAAISGFGIGSLLTPVLAQAVDTRLAVAAVAIPHFVGTLQRLWIMRRHVDRRLFLAFGITSALGGLAGALLHTWISSRGLSLVFGGLLVFAGLSELTGWMREVRWGRGTAWLAGALSGVFGGMVGNQGGIRTAALLGLEVPREAFVATATASALVVDLARLPVYLATQGREILALRGLVLIATLGVVAGTAAGGVLLARFSEKWFRRAVAILLLLLGVWMLSEW
jgi:uncharacterized membrane protein YfcA